MSNFDNDDDLNFSIADTTTKIENKNTDVYKPLNSYPTYTKYDFQREVFGVNIVELIEILKYHKNIILQGPPGVGKTYTAQRLGYAMLEYKDPTRVLQVQFHQSYNYEDFIMGLRPTISGGFKFGYGPFYKMCKRAENDPEHKPYFIIIDEINRGNMSKILGEMFSLIEKDHRNEKIMLKYNEEEFSVPDNLYIIGTMNTADRGLVMLDYALRRRFAFYPMEPQFKSDGFRQILSQNGNMLFNKIIRKISDLNKVIADDDMLGPGFQIGHSYFCSKNKITNEELANILHYDILPLLAEYWYDDTDGKLVTWNDTFEKLISDSRKQQ